MSRLSCFRSVWYPLLEPKREEVEGRCLTRVKLNQGGHWLVRARSYRIVSRVDSCQTE